MTKVLQASCSANIVKVSGTPLPQATKLSKGIGASQGLAVLDEDKQFYLANTQPDLERTLDKINETIDKLAPAMTKLAAILTSIGAGMTGPSTAPPPTLATDVAEITQVATDLNLIKTQITTLKGDLI